MSNVRPGQVDSQFIVRDISKSHASGRSYFVVQLIALLEQSDCSIIRIFQSKIPNMKFHAGAFRSMWVVMINCESSWPGLNFWTCKDVRTRCMYAHTATLVSRGLTVFLPRRLSIGNYKQLLRKGSGTE